MTHFHKTNFFPHGDFTLRSSRKLVEWPAVGKRLSKFRFQFLFYFQCETELLQVKAGSILKLLRSWSLWLPTNRKLELYLFHLMTLLVILWFKKKRIIIASLCGAIEHGRKHTRILLGNNSNTQIHSLVADLWPCPLSFHPASPPLLWHLHPFGLCSHVPLGPRTGPGSLFLGWCLLLKTNKAACGFLWAPGRPGFYLHMNVGTYFATCPPSLDSFPQ